MNQFALPAWQIILASSLGLFLFSMNFITIFINSSLSHWWQFLIIIIVAILYLSFFVNAILEPVKELKSQSEEEIEDHEYEKINVEE